MTPEMERQLLQLYAEGQSAPQILKALGYPFKTPKTIYDLLHRHGLPVRRPSRIDDALTSCWPEAFAEITTEAQAYWLGMLTADGWVSQGRAIFYGTERLVGGIADHLTRVLGVTHKTPKPVLSIFGISWQRQHDVRAVLDYLYTDASIFLARKHALYTRFLELSTVPA